MKYNVKKYTVNKIICACLCLAISSGFVGCTSTSAIEKITDTPTATEIPKTEESQTETLKTEIPSIEFTQTETHQKEITPPNAMQTSPTIEEQQPTSLEDSTNDISDNKITNPDFSDGINGWGIYLEGGEATLSADDEGQGVIDIKKLGGVSWGVQLTHDNISLTKGNKYRLTFDCVSTITRTGTVRIQKNSDPYTGYVEREINLSQRDRTYSFEFSMLDETDPACRLVINLGVYSDNSDSEPEEHIVKIDNFELILLEGEEYDTVAKVEVPKIHVDQIGYATLEKKYAVIISADDLFEIIDAESDRSVFTGKASAQIKSYASDEYVRIADFTDLYTEGTYYIKNSEGRSYEFKIGNDLYGILNDAVLNMLDYQKCGVKVEAGVWAHEACHAQYAYVYGTDEAVNVTGGWHDAGDYGRYVVPAAKTVADILIPYEKGWVNNRLGLETARYELEWLFKMQDKKTGGVYHKVTAENFCGIIMPDAENDKLVLSPISATATADFAAIMAMTARLYDGDFGIAALAAAEKAWEWLEANPEYDGFKNPEGITTGEYGDDFDKDERYWAACELYRTTGKDVYHDYVKNSVAYQGFGWADMGYYGSVSYLNVPFGLRDKETYLRIEASVYAGAKNVLASMSEDPYKISLGREYPWGSNMSVANNAMLLIYGIDLTKETEFVQAVREHVHYLLGRNALSQSYVTGFGDNASANPHHRPSMVAGYAVPGMLVGGPSGGLEDPYAASVLAGSPPAKAYVDNDQSYSTNEITIYWNSPLYFILSYLQKIAL